MDDGIGLLVVSVPVGMCLYPRMIPGRVVSHPVKDDSHAVLVTDLCEVLEVVDGTKLRGDGLVVADAVGGVLAFLDTDGVDGHHPHHVDAKVADGIDTNCYGIQRVLWRKHTGIHLIHGDILHGGHLEGLFYLLRRFTGYDCCQYGNIKKQFLHVG